MLRLPQRDGSKGKKDISNPLLEHGYQAIDTKRRDHLGGRIFELRAPNGEKVASYGAVSLESVLPEMRREIERRDAWL